MDLSLHPQRDRVLVHGQASNGNTALETPDTKTIEQGDLRILLDRQKTPEGWRICGCVYQRGQLVEEVRYVMCSEDVAQKIDRDGKVAASAWHETDGTLTVRAPALGLEQIFTPEDILDAVR